MFDVRGWDVASLVGDGSALGMSRPDGLISVPKLESIDELRMLYHSLSDH